MGFRSFRTRVRLCARCRERGAQHRRQYCRRCEREAALPMAVEQHADSLAHVNQKIEALRVPAGQPRPNIMRIIDGQEFEITWDGS